MLVILSNKSVYCVVFLIHKFHSIRKILAKMGEDHISRLLDQNNRARRDNDFEHRQGLVQILKNRARIIKAQSISYDSFKNVCI